MTSSGNRLRTPLCDRLGIEAPIIGAPISSDSKLVSAVSNAGGLGLLQGTWLNPDDMRETIRKTKRLTDKPFGVNFVLHWSPDKNLSVCLEEGVKIISFFWGDPAPFIKRVHDSGGLVMCTVASAAEASAISKAGADILVAQGWEAGGHVWGKVASMPLIPIVVDAVRPKPVVAAGGIAEGRGVAAALMLGASGVWLGTRFVASEESPFHPVYKERVLKASETDTEYTTIFDLGWEDSPHRTLRNGTIEMWEKAGRPESGKRPEEGEVLVTMSGRGKVPRYATTSPKVGMEGKVEDLALYAGQSAGLVSKVRPVAEIVRELVAGAIEVIRRADTLIV